MNDETSTGNVFEDLGFDEPEEELAKAKLTIQIRDIINEKKMTQTDAGRKLGISQTEVSNLVRGNVGRFTLDRILRYLTVLGMDVEIVTRPPPEGRHATIHVGSIA